MADNSIASTWAAARQMWRNVKALAAADLIAELRAISSKIDALDSHSHAAGVDLVTELRALSGKLDALDYYSHGARAVYVGNNRVLMKAVVAGAQIAFLLEA